MRDRDMRVAVRFGLDKRVKELEAALLAIAHVVEVDIDLDGFLSEIYQLVIVPKYDIPASLPNYFDVRREMLRNILKVAESFGLSNSGDSIEDMGEHYYIVRQCDDTWKVPARKLRTCWTQFGHWNRDVEKKLRDNGFHVYGVRDASGVHYTIEPFVLCDNIGHIVTDFDLDPFMHKSGTLCWMEDKEYEALSTEEIRLEEFLTEV